MLSEWILWFLALVGLLPVVAATKGDGSDKDAARIKQKKIEEVNRSLNTQKGHLTRAIKKAETLIDIFKNQTTKETEDKLEAEFVTVQDHLVKIIELFEKLHELNTDTDQAGELVTKQAEQETRVDELLDKINEAQVNAAKKAGTPVTSVSSQETATKCKVVTALKPELLQLDDSPAKLRVWKQDFKTYFNGSNMTRSSQEAQHAYFLACLSTTLKDKVRNLIDYLPVLSADTSTRTCFTILDEINRSNTTVLVQKNTIGSPFYDSKTHRDDCQNILRYGKRFT